MVEYTYNASQLCCRPLTMIEPDIRQAANIGHDCQAQIDDETANRTGNDFALKVGESSKETIQVTPAVVVQNANQADTRTWRNVTNKSSDGKAMIRHEIVARFVLQI